MLVRVAVRESDMHFVTSNHLLRWSGNDVVPMRGLTPVEADFLLSDPARVPPARLGADPQAWATDKGFWWPVLVVETEAW